MKRRRPAKKRISKKVLRWRKVKAATPFALACGFIALAYFLYRIFMVALPAAVISEEYLGTSKARNVVCRPQEDKANTHDNSPVLSEAYQNTIKNQQRLSPNMVANPNLTLLDDNDGIQGYVHTVDNSNVTYTRQWDQNLGNYFLHLANMQPKTVEPAAAPGWTTDPIAIVPGETYAYGFAYRSNVPLHVSLELTVRGAPAYKSVTELPTTNVWRDFTTHFQNSDNADTLRIIVTTQDPGEFDVRNYEVHRIPSAQLPQGMVSITFDDGWQSVHDQAVPLLQKYGMHSTQFIISEVSQKKTPEYMDLGTVSKMQKAGMEIGSHSLRHCNQTTLSQAEIYRDARDSKRILKNEKLGSINIYAYPLGQYDEKTQSVIAKQYDYIRTSDVGYNDRYFDPENIRSMAVLNTTSLAEFRQWLDYAIHHKAWLVIAYHRIDEQGEYSVTSKQLDEQLHAIKQSNIPVMPLGKAAQEIQKQ